MTKVVRLRNRQSNYIRKKKPKSSYSVDLSLSNYIVKGTPLPINIYIRTSQEIAAFADVINAIDKRKELIAKSKNREHGSINTLNGLSEKCLTVAANKDIPDDMIANKLFAAFVDDEIHSNKQLTNMVTYARKHLKDAIGEDNYNNSAFTKDDYALLYIQSYKRNNLWLSLDDKTIDIYKKVVDYWNTNTQIINNKFYSWDDIYNIYYNKRPKPNSVRFINQFCKSTGISRGTMQVLLIVYNDKDCFTDDDLQVITNGQSDLLTILSKIQILTEK